MSEIKIYEELSKLADKYCFLAYYGSCTYEVNGIRQLALIIQWVDKSLAEYLKESQSYIPEDQLKTWYIKLFESYYELHNQKIYHLDIKPHNILIDENLFLYIIDFDVSIQEIEIKTISATVDTFAVGTDSYAYPNIQEALDSKTAIGMGGYHKSDADIYSFGLTFLHMAILKGFKDGLNKRKNYNQLEEAIKSVKFDGLKI